jgi:rod shape determining protein RodA
MTLWERIKTVFKFILKMDLVLIVLVMSLLSFSVFVIYHVGVESGGDLQKYWIKQVVWICLGFVLMVAIAYVDYGWIGQQSWMFYLFGLFLLILVIIPGVGKEINGARSWISFPGLSSITIQPSEIAKPCTIVALAWYAAQPRVLLHQLTSILPVILLAALPVFLIGLQPDFGSALVFIPITATVLFVAGCKIRYLTYPLLMAAILTPAIYFMLKPHQKKRIDVFIHPFVQPVIVDYSVKEATRIKLPEDKINRIEKMSNPWHYTKTEMAYFQKEISKEEYNELRKSYETVRHFLANGGFQAYQSALAVGSGGKLGKGWGNGTQIKLGYLPRGVTTTDCIFSVICEEGGFLWAMIVLLLILGVILCTIRTACVARDMYGRILAISIGMLYLCHTYINVGMAIGIAPIIGIPLPFLSYGGSFIISTMVCVGILQSVYIRREVTASEHRLSDIF